MKRKIAALFLAALVAVGMTNSADAREIPLSGIDGNGNVLCFGDPDEEYENFDFTGSGTVRTVMADYAAVIVDEVEKPDEGPDIFRTEVIYAQNDAKVYVKGDVKALGPDAKVGVKLKGSEAYIEGDLVVRGGADSTIGAECGIRHRVVRPSNNNMGVSDSEFNSDLGLEREMVLDPIRADAILIPSKLFVGGNVSVVAPGPVLGVKVTDSDVHFAGDAFFKSVDDGVFGLLCQGETNVYIDGVLTVESEQGVAYPFACLDVPEENLYKKYFLNKVVVKAGCEVPPTGYVPGVDFVVPDRECIYYMINTDSYLSTNASAFSPEGENNYRQYANAGEVVIVSSNDSRVIGIKNADESIDLNITDNGDGTWSITVPENGGVDIQAVFGNTGDVSDNDPIDDVSEDDASAHINDTASATIMAALSGGFPVSENATMVPGVGAVTVSENAIYIVSSSCGYFDRGDLTNMSSMPKDVYITFVYDGRTYRYMIPANTDLTQFANEEGYAGYLYLSEMFGRYEIIDGVAVLVIPAKAKLQ